MKYHEYMAQFALLDETKTVLMGRMKQRERQLRAAGAKNAPRTASAAAAPKKNTFRLHPMRWAAVFMSIALVVTATPVLAVFVPRGGENNNIVSTVPGDDNGGGNNNFINTIKLEYMENLMVDTTGVTAYSIRMETEEEPAETIAFTDAKERAAISLLSGQILERRNAEPLEKSEKKGRRYLYSTTASYEAGNVEYDETGIKKVTFMKNTEVTKDVYDKNGNLIDANRRIEQEELDAQINRMYTTKRFTFVQYVAMVENSGRYQYKDENGEVASEYLELRPDSLDYDENGTASFDEGNVVQNSSHVICVQQPDKPAYFSSALSTSFVIDNITGYIYKIEGLKICGFVNNLVVDSTESVYTISVNADNNLVFTDVMPNKDVKVYDGFMDNDGWTYVYNDTLDETDQEKKIIRYTNEIYRQDREGNVYIEEHEKWPYYIEYKMVDGIPTRFENRGLIKMRARGDYDNILGLYNDITILSGCVIYHSAVTGESIYILARDKNDTFGLDADAYNGWLDDNFDMLIRRQDGQLYYKSVDLAECVDELVTIRNSEFTQFCDFNVEEVKDYYMSVGNDRYKVENVYRYKGANETKYYRVVRTETGLGLEELTSKSYADNIFIFQPINK